ncbi:MAG: hypothetical protein EZS28_035602, partial [Streblomastix strix]
MAQLSHNGAIGLGKILVREAQKY